MKLYLVGVCFFLYSVSTIHDSIAEHIQDLSDNEFAEFETEDETYIQDIPMDEVDEDYINKDLPIVEGDMTIDEDLELEHLQDGEEFEGFEVTEEKPTAQPEITIAKIPINFRQNWDSYYLEILMICGLIIYFINFATGRNKNNKIAYTWFQTHRQILEDNFSLVGDDGTSERNETVNLIKESENIFTLWCSGRSCCEGMLVELKLIKRQDLLAILSRMIRPASDQIHITVRMNKEDMDNFVFCVASKKTATYLSKEMTDISVFCPERKAGEKFNILAGFNVMSENSEATSAMLDSKLLAALNKYPEYIDYIHFSDQFSGPRQSDDGTALKLPDTEKVKQKLKKNRQRVEEAFLKSTHQARAEAAAAKREERRRQEKEKIMAEEDPDRQRRWELKEEKRQAKKRAPKMKQLKVKAL
ncbi:hypothetical protein NQ318_010548 [Aromia moschata]|uniref:PAT complex subunit CCDC47 n=1 Tax=Aromia moschata TaxID=1265417 RepID=A0AAV8XCA2_9CUCU|nr:hypothetical protein NQ318_010548 [Aromia moschata]